MRIGALVILVIVSSSSGARAQEAETETARTLRQGVVKGGASLEYQTSSDGSEAALPMFVEGGLLDRLELVVEPVPFTAIRPKVGTHATGAGDLEITLVGALPEQMHVPAIAIAAEVKVPTARNMLIGTREVDYAGYLIASKRFGNLDLHVNASYTIVGAPPNTNVSNTFGFALLARYFIGRADLFAEVLGTTAATPDSEGMGGAAELTGSELVGTVGGGWFATRWLQLYLGASVDNNVAFVIHPGFLLVHKLL